MKKINLLLFVLCFTIVLNAQVSKTADITAGNLKTVLTDEERSTVTNLTLTGTIDARDFKTMRDEMPLLAEIDLSSVTVTSYDGTDGTQDQYDNYYPANTIPYTAFYSITNEQGKSSLTSILLPSTLTSIAVGAFYECTGLVTVSIPSTLTSFEILAFALCSNLSEISIPYGVTSIGERAFYGCGNLTSIVVNPSYPVDLSNTQEVFSGVNKNLCNLNVPFGAKGLYAAANQWGDFTNIIEEETGIFVNKANLKLGVTGGSNETVGIIANVAWEASSDKFWLKVDPTSGTGNQALTLTFEANQEQLSRSSKITVSANGTASQILNVQQDGLNKTINVTAGGLLTALTGVELYGISDLKITGVIDARDFKTMRDLMPNLSVLDLTGAKVAAYSGTEGTSGNYLSDYYANAIPAYAFYDNNTEKGKSSLTTLALPESTTSIEYYAFQGCSGLTTLIIPPSVTTIGYSAFKGCISLPSINIPASVSNIGYGAFTNFGGLFNVDAGNFYYSSIDGVLFDKSKKTLIQCPISKTGNYEIPSSVIYVEYGAFVGCVNLTEVSIPSAVANIASDAFNNCTGLISVDAANQNYSGIDGVLFNKDATNLIKCPVSKSGSFVIPSKVAAIGEYAFFQCKLLNSITIPQSVKSIGNGAFGFCDGLTSITVNSSYPIQFENYTYVFDGINQTTCVLNVPYGSKKLYAAAEQWKDFVNIVEKPDGFILSTNFLRIDADNSSNDTVNIVANVAWSVVSNQLWLAVNPTSGTGNNTLNITADANTSITPRTAIVKVSSTDFESHTITVTQIGLPQNITNTAGNILSNLSQTELSQISNLKISGTMDARDFRILRDSMPSLEDLDLSGATIVAYYGMEGTFYYTIDYPANAIPQNAFYNTYASNSNLTSIILPSSLTSIEDQAFWDCTGLTSIIIPQSVTEIGDGAFGNCSGLTSINIPQSVTIIGNTAFASCTGLTSITAESSYPVDLSNSYSVFDGVNKTTCQLNVPYLSKQLYSEAAQWNEFESIVEETDGFLISAESLKLQADAGSSDTLNIKANILWNASSDQSWLTVDPTSGTGETIINFSAQANTSAITRTAKVTISATNITSQHITVNQVGVPKIINIEAGKLATSLTVAELEGITSLTLTGTIDARDFKTMRDLMPLLEVVNLKDIEVVAYSGYEGTVEYLSQFYPANEIPQYAFYSTNGISKKSLKSITFPSTVTSIGDWAFSNCSGIDSLTFGSPSSLQNIGIYAFVGCSGLESVILPSSITTIEKGAFNNCSLLSKIVFEPNSALKNIGTYAFRACSALTSVLIPSMVTNIDYGAFYGCFMLKLIEFESNTNLTSIGTYAFGNCTGLTSFTILKSVTSVGDVVFLGTNVSLTVDADNPNYSVLNGVLYDKDKTRLMYCPVSKNGILDIPSTVKTIAVDAFYNCSGLTEITLPPTLMTIEDWAFENCFNLASISIPSMVSSLGNNAFYNCFRLTSIYANGSVPVDLSSKADVFIGVDKTNCTLYVPFKSKMAYQSAAQWKDFKNIIEATEGFNLSANKLFISEIEGSTAFVDIASNVNWSINASEPWLSVNPASGNANSTINFMANGNTEVFNRIANVTVSANGFDSQMITIIQAGIPKTINVEAGGLFSGLTTDELFGITKLKITGTIDARDFRIMRDSMPSLAVLDLSGAKIAAYSGDGGTSYESFYPANEVPGYAFFDNNTYIGKTSLDSVLLPKTLTSIGASAFNGCTGLSTLTIPSTVTAIANSAFINCSGLTSIYANSNIPVDLHYSWSVFYGIDQTKCILYVPYGSAQLYVLAYQWQDFTNIVEMPNLELTILELSVTEANLSNMEGSTTTVDLITNTIWQVSSDQAWLSIDTIAGKGNITITFMAKANPDSSPRIATVTVSGKDIESQTIIITQDGISVEVNDIAEKSASVKYYPNPFVGKINIEIQNPELDEITVDIYNLTGELIKILANKSKSETLDLIWNGTNSKGQRVASGVYICKMNNQSKRLIFGGN